MHPTQLHINVFLSPSLSLLLFWAETRSVPHAVLMLPLAGRLSDCRNIYGHQSMKSCRAGLDAAATAGHTQSAACLSSGQHLHDAAGTPCLLLCGGMCVCAQHQPPVHSCSAPAFNDAVVTHQEGLQLPKICIWLGVKLKPLVNFWIFHSVRLWTQNRIWRLYLCSVTTQEAPWSAFRCLFFGWFSECKHP